MLRFNLIEIINRILGVIITALISRILVENYGEFLSYQTIFSYLFVLSMFSSDYTFLIKYESNKNYLESNSFYQVYGLKIILVFFTVLIAIFSFPSNKIFIIWPYFISILLSLFMFDFVLYIKNDKDNLIKFRFISQIITLIVVIVFYYKYLPYSYITAIQPIQTSILTLGTFFAAKKHIKLPKIKDFLKKILINLIRLKVKTIKELFSYFIVKNFLIYIISIEVIILFYFGLSNIGNTFAEGLRITAILTPFVTFYISFNINSTKKSFFKIIVFLSIILLFFSPIYLLIFGEYFLKNVFFYNFFIVSFMFSSFLGNDNLSLLTSSKNHQYKLTIINEIFFISYCFIFTCLLIFFSFSLEILILISILKYIIYYITYGLFFKTYFKNFHIIISFFIIIVVNFILKYVGYYTIMTYYTIHVLHHLKSYFIS